MKQKSKCGPVVSAAVKAAGAEAVGLTLTRNPIVAIATAVVASLLGLMDGSTRPAGRPEVRADKRPGRRSQSTWEAYRKQSGSTPVKAVAKATAFAGVGKGGVLHG